MKAEQVSAIIVTRGDVDLTEILDTLPYGEVVVWDNSKKEEDAKTFGRFLAIDEALSDVIYFQDDDIVFTEHEKLLALYKPGRITTNMPSPWYEEQCYDVFRCSLVGAGSLVPRNLSQSAFARYLEHWPKDDLFLTYCDFVHGILTPSARYDFGYQVLPQATAKNRICAQPRAAERKQEIIDRSIAIRDT